MPKGFFTQAMVILLRQEMDIKEVRGMLPGLTVLKETPASEHWEFGAPSLTIEYDRRTNGCVVVDVVNLPWPDDMGDPKSNPVLFGAWSMGHFGPFAYPQGLERAIQQSWNWPEAKELVRTHRGFIRFRMSYVLGADENAPVLPQDYAPVRELEFLTSMAASVLAHPNALCYFNPNGEVVLNRQLFDESTAYHKQHDLPPLEVWSNVRLFNLSRNWLFMDSVGSWQVDVPDQEVALPRELLTPQQVDSFIRNASLYVINNGMVIKDGDTMDGPDDTLWQARILENSLSSPPRRVIRWLPAQAHDIPDELLKNPLA